MELKLNNGCNLLPIIEYIKQFYSTEKVDMFTTDIVIIYYIENIK